MDYVEKRMAAEAQRPAGAEVTSLATPLNLLLLSLLALLTYTTFRPKKAAPIPTPPAQLSSAPSRPPNSSPSPASTIPPSTSLFAAASSMLVTGETSMGLVDRMRILRGETRVVGWRRVVFDAEMLTEDLQAELDSLEDLDGEELDALKGWEERFEEKYLVVGRLVSVCAEGEGGEGQGGEGEGGEGEGLGGWLWDLRGWEIFFFGSDEKWGTGNGEYGMGNMECGV
ncbi:hypothetical protein DID88_003504 [Monilinia fructigena]|uniref:Uncharacterized protein n=1 Tax=Monilinia fructigena TaxID=38457 RepID=A0A395IUP6_9HELO|nr:hypothetical protein DID88_003504 [Monilinia fructigena]